MSRAERADRERGESNAAKHSQLSQLTLLWLCQLTLWATATHLGLKKVHMLIRNYVKEVLG